MNISEKIGALPLSSGVYLMRDAAGRVIYVGKAVSLRKRVQSYFRPSRGVSSKTDVLVNEIRAIDHIETSSEAEALLLEASLIKKYQPKYNVELKDDKSYPYIEITGEPFPRISLIRRIAFERGQARDAKGAVYYGPYVSAGLIREALTIIRRIFHFRACDPFPVRRAWIIISGSATRPASAISARRITPVTSATRALSSEAKRMFSTKILK